MSITNAGFYQKNIDLFSRLDKDIGDIQLEVSTGKNSLSLKKDLHAISNLNASEEHKLELTQFKNNAERVISDLEKINLSFDQLQNTAIRLKELYVQSSNGLRTPADRIMFKNQITAIKEEIFVIANSADAFGNGYFSGISGVAEPFKVDNFGSVSYSGAASAKSLQMSHDSDLRQNFSGNEVFLSAGQVNAKFSVFDAIDAFAESLDYEYPAGQSSNLFSATTSIDLVLPGSGQSAQYKFDLVANGSSYSIDANVYANDFSSVVAKINSHTGSSGVTAVVSSDNKIRLSGTGINLKIENYVTDLPSNLVRSIEVQKVVGSNVTDEVIIPHSISNAKVGTQLNDLFEHFNSLGVDLSIATKVAEGVVESTENTLVYLSEDISKIEDVDMATLLTKLQGLLTSQEAAQATFSRITSKNLFDYMG